MHDLKLTLQDLVEILNAAGAQYHLTGGLASSFYGEPRFTQDIDVVIKITAGIAFDGLIENLCRKFIVDREALADAVRDNRLFQALHEETMIKIDFHVGEAITGELQRSQKEEIFSGVIVPLVSREDAILSKLIWMSKGSHKSKHDLLMMLQRQGTVDFDYLNQHASALGLSSLWNEINAESKD